MSEPDVLVGLGMSVVDLLGRVRLAVGGAGTLLGVHMVVRLATLGGLAVARTRRHKEAAAAAADGLVVRREHRRRERLEHGAAELGQRAQHERPGDEIGVRPTGPQWDPGLTPVGLTGRTATREGMNLPGIAPESYHSDRPSAWARAARVSPRSSHQ